jgi:hypothetical protein
LFSAGRRVVEEFQLQSARRRFEELAPRLAALKDQADRNAVTRIESLEDITPLLFNDTVYKSYPISLLENARFDLLTRWLQRVTSIDLSGVRVEECTGMDDWMDALERTTPLRIYHTSGTTGKISLIPRTTLEHALCAHSNLSACGGGFGGEPSVVLGGHDGLRLPVVFPGARYGRYAGQRMVDHHSRFVAPTPAECYTLTDGTLSADLVSLTGRVRIAQAKGETSKLKLSASQREGLKRYLEEQERRPRDMAEFFARMTDELRGRRVMLFSQTYFLYLAAIAGLERNITHAFAPDSLILTGGGGKGALLPENWGEPIRQFTGIRSWKTLYGMTELCSFMPSCPYGHYHLHPHIVPFLLDPVSGSPLARQGTQTGRFAALDLLAQTYWGGIITGDRVTIEWDSACPCGRKGAFVLSDIERYSSEVTGDDKVNCSATIDNTDVALHRLLTH